MHKSERASENEKENRAKALEYALAVNRLLDSRFFPVALQAVETHDEELFEQVCEKADIPANMIQCLKDVVFVNPLSVSPAW